MSQPVERQIDDPVINSPFEEPQRHYEFDDEGITNRIVAGRRVSSYFVPIPRSRKRSRGQQLSFETEWTQDRVEENKFVESVRRRVRIWREGGYVGTTRTTRRLLDYWQRDGRERRLFFAQIEAIETARCGAALGWCPTQLVRVTLLPPAAPI
jgi:type III restriction enzyme